MVNEFPKPLGLIGVLLIVMGSYTLNIKERHGGYLAPIRALFRETGPRLMLLVAFIWSITSNIDKIGIKNSSPVFWAAAQSAFIAIVLFPIIMKRSKHHIAQVPKNLKSLASIGLFSALSLVSQMTALSFAFVVYVSSIKRTSSIIGVLAGHFIFKESGVKERLTGAIIMVLGVVLIALS